jgi:structural hemagglutinin/hemolysin toxin protein RtxA
MYHIAFYVPVTHAETVKQSMFATGAGKLGHYDRCSFETKGLGQFRGLEESQPFLGEKGKIERVEELKVEMICDEIYLSEAIKALKSSHPYETPAYYVIKMVGI